MLSHLIALILIGPLLYLWSRGRQAAELAQQVGRQACARAGVQLLDHTVMLQGMALRRAASGWLAIERRYRFEYSRDGLDRHRGGLALLDGEVVWLNAPEAEPQPALDGGPTAH